jgi:hypothetical protein
MLEIKIRRKLLSQCPIVTHKNTKDNNHKTSNILAQRPIGSDSGKGQRNVLGVGDMRCRSGIWGGGMNIA